MQRFVHEVFFVEANQLQLHFFGQICLQQAPQLEHKTFVIAKELNAAPEVIIDKGVIRFDLFFLGHCTVVEKSCVRLKRLHFLDEHSWRLELD